MHRRRPTSAGRLSAIIKNRNRSQSGSKCTTCTLALLFTLLLAVFAGCGVPSGDEAHTEAVDTVRTLFIALAGSDQEMLERVAPDLAATAPGALAQITAALSEQGAPEIGEPLVSGRRATVPVAFGAADGGVEAGDGDTGLGEQTTRLLVPLRWRRGRWQVDPTLTITQSFDIIRFSE